jgi:hypothetical protein
MSPALRTTALLLIYALSIRTIMSASRQDVHGVKPSMVSVAARKQFAVYKKTDTDVRIKRPSIASGNSLGSAKVYRLDITTTIP